MTLHHHRTGRGEPLLLIHGVGHHWQAWEPVIGPLAWHFDVLAPDSPGFGRSPDLPPGSAHDVRTYAEAFAGFLDELGLERVHVAGNSMGGGIALELARRGRARSVTAISPVGFWSATERRFCQLSLGAVGRLPGPVRPLLRVAVGSRAGRTALLAQNFARPWRIPAGVARNTLDDFWGAPALDAALAAFDAYDFGDGDELRGTPVTIAWGSRDRLLLFGPQSRRARERLPWARHVTLPGLGHAPSSDDPGVVAEVIRRTAAEGAVAPPLQPV